MKKVKLSTLRKKLWFALTCYVKKRDGRVCITCGKQIELGKGLHSGHFIPAKVGGIELKYDECNVHVQCFFCNRNIGGFGAMYYVQMVIKYGQKFVDSLFKRYIYQKTHKVTWDENDYLKKIKYFENKLKKL